TSLQLLFQRRNGFPSDAARVVDHLRDWRSPAAEHFDHPTILVTVGFVCQPFGVAFESHRSPRRRDSRERAAARDDAMNAVPLDLFSQSDGFGLRHEQLPFGIDSYLAGWSVARAARSLRFGLSLRRLDAKIAAARE